MTTDLQTCSLTLDEAEIHRIINIIFIKTKIPYSQMIEKTRKKEVVIARQVAMFFIKINNEHISLKQIGFYFGGRDHSTVIHSIEVVQGQYQVNSTFKRNLIEICEEINPELKLKLEELIK